MLLPTVIALSVLIVSQEEFAEAAGCRYGQIIIVGNTETPDHVILTLHTMRPGQPLSAAGVRAARSDIRACGLFKVNPWQNTEPTVELVPSEFDEVFRDILIRVEEKPWNWLNFGLVGLVESIVNLDIDGFTMTLHQLQRAGRISVPDGR